MMKPRKIPMRQCIVTKERFPKQDLLRIVKFNDEVFVDATGKQNGKGCYIKKDRDVLEKAKKTKAIERALECTIAESLYEEIDKLID